MNRLPAALLVAVSLAACGSKQAPPAQAALESPPRLERGEPKIPSDPVSPQVSPDESADAGSRSPLLRCTRCETGYGIDRRDRDRAIVLFAQENHIGVLNAALRLSGWAEDHACADRVVREAINKCRGAIDQSRSRSRALKSARRG
jgi:hypothetical protein